ncbi:MAG: cell division protein FtsX [Paracoccaceae bacterium]
MTGFAKVVAGLVIGDREAARTVPQTGFTAWLTGLTAAAMTFLAVVALGFAASATRLAEDWRAGLAASSTVTIPASAASPEAQRSAVLRVLETTPGIASARAVSEEAQLALLAPWLGDDLPGDVLRLPVLIEITETADGPDREGLVLRLAGEAPDAVFDDHSRWRRPLIAAADRLRWVSLASLGVTLAVLAAAVALAVQAALSANGRVIETLRLIGARDSYVIRAFVRRYTLRCAAGSAAGAIAGAVAVLAVAAGQPPGGPVVGPELRGLQWLWAAALPLASVLIAFVAARLTTIANLRHLP